MDHKRISGTEPSSVILKSLCLFYQTADWKTTGRDMAKLYDKDIAELK